MNQRVAKRCRKKLGYKPYAKRRYGGASGQHGVTLTALGKRREYQEAKKEYLTVKRKG
jgi:hypothetical protein